MMQGNRVGTSENQTISGFRAEVTQTPEIPDALAEQIRLICEQEELIANLMSRIEPLRARRIEGETKNAPRTLYHAHVSIEIGENNTRLAAVIAVLRAALEELEI
jgi:hypothetical protein